MGTLPFPTTNDSLDEPPCFVRLILVVPLILLGWSGVGPPASEANPLAPLQPVVSTTVPPPPDSQHTPPPLFPRTRISAWYAHSISSGSVLGKIPRGRLRILGVRYQRLLLPTAQQADSDYRAPSLWFTADLAATGVHIPAPATPDPFFQEDPTRNDALSTRGLGTYPLGLRLEFRNRQGLRPFIAGHTGMFYFLDAVPDERGHRVNFAAGLGGGARIALTTHTVLTFGYRYHHLSNGFRGSINPGFDANVLYLGVGTAL